MPIKISKEVAMNLDQVVTWGRDLETTVQQLQAQIADLLSDKVQINQPMPDHESGFCPVPDRCHLCQPYLVQVKQNYIRAAQDGQAAGRNALIELLMKAAENLGLTEAAEVLAAEAAQIEAGRSATPATIGGLTLVAD